ncbi:polysaccharide biosynthesis C-terminal domain-containing protein [Rubricoccus marinus]|uniref:Uncharacterized protein n=1 Tax=Rubricoccus marinus TaxID=716817 RepID=A0A259U0Q8_9BACT|nr:polysaccharide biosynthesis C-terminal domain-containing protein [Rubricoccus marinus]OZC03582.1 hypothetical protein BSZ36_11675 [Rubricoccus marinus]
MPDAPAPDSADAAPEAQTASGGGWRLIRQSGLYALSGVALKLGGLLLAPLYLDTALLSKAEYGQLFQLEVTAQIGVLLGGLGLASGLLRFLADPKHADDHAALPGTALVASGAVAALVALGFGLLAPVLAPVLMAPQANPAIIWWLGLYVAMKVIGGVPYAVLRAKERAGVFALGVAVEMAVLVAAVWYFLGTEGLGLEGVMRAYAMSAGASAAILVAVVLARGGWRIRTRLIRPLAVYGVPLALGGLGGLMLNAGDRYLLGWIAGDEALAVYGWAARIGGILNVLLVQSLQLAFLAIGLKTLYGADGKLTDSTLHPRVFRHFAALGGFAALGLSLVTFDGTRILSSEPAYLGASGLVLPVALGYVGYGLYFVVVNVLYAAGETRRISQGVIGAAVGNAVLNLLLIPPFGAMGAALATVASFAGLALYAERVARRHAPIRYPWGAALASGVIAAVLALAAMPSEAWGLWPRVALRAGLLACYPAALFALGLYEVREIRNGLAMARGWLRQRP